MNNTTENKPEKKIIRFEVSENVIILVGVICFFATIIIGLLTGAVK
jgi:hypothetical protein